MKLNKTLVVILGPTGIGKTDLSIDVAKALNSEIISCDSRQFFSELKIGTAAPEQEYLDAVQHHFIGNLSIHDYYSVSKFELDVMEKLPELFQHSDYAVMTGGSGLYLDAVVKGIDELPNIDPTIRERINKDFEEKGLYYIQEKVKSIDPEYYEIADPYNGKRLLKVIEVFEMTGKKYSTFRTNQAKKRPFNIIQVGLSMDRPALYERINLRVDLMMKAGLVDEARTFYPYKKLNALNTVGYKELFGHFDGEYDLDEAIRLIKRNSRRYAKRQLTWFKRDQSIQWFHPSEEEKILAYIEHRDK